MDYTKFLGKKETLVLPYLGGAHVYAKDRRLRIDGAADARPSIGFHRFEVSGRDARRLEAAEPPDDPAFYAGCQKARGHHVAGWLAHGARLDRLAMLPDEELAALSTTRVRRWHSGDWLFVSSDFDGEVEEEARVRLERRESLGGVSGVSSTLRTAFGVAAALAAARRNHVDLSIREAAPYALRIADGGGEVAAAAVAAVVTERRAAQERALHAALEARDRAQVRKLLANRPQAAARRTSHEAPTVRNAAARAEEALDSADARMLSTRRLGEDNLEVVFEFMGERFISVVDAISLQVFDSGVCLAGADELVTIDSLPGVIREAIDTGRLVITRR